MVTSLFFSASCDDDDDNTTTPPMTETAKIRVIHGSYDAPAVDVRVDGAVAISGLAYRQSSGYAEVNAGTRNVSVTPTGATTPVVINADLTLQADKEYTVYAVGDLANITAIVSEDERTPSANNAKVRFVHAAPDAPAVDIKVNDGSGTAVFGNAAFKDITAYAEVPAGNYTFVVTPAGSTAEVVVFKPVDLTAGTVYTVVAFGTLNNTDNVDFGVRVFIDNNNGDGAVDFTPATANVLVTHASPDAPGVDFLLDGIVVNSAPLTYPNNTGYLVVPAGTRNVKVNASGTTTTVIDANLNLRPNANYSVFAVNFLSSIEPLVLEDDLTPPASGKAHVRFLHASPDAPTVDITLTDGTVVFDDYAFKQASPFTPLDAGTYDLQVRTADGSQVVLDLPGIALESGKIYTVFARGSVNGTGGADLGAEIIVNN